MIAADLALPLSIAAPLLGAIAIWLLDKAPNFREAVSLVLGTVLLVFASIVFAAVGASARPVCLVLTAAPGLDVVLKAEPLGAMFALLASGLFLVNTLYSIGYMRGNGEKNQTRFYMCFAVAIAAAMGVAYAGNLLTLFIFYEVLTLSTYPLVTHRGDDAARRGGRVYLGLLMATSIGLLLPAVVWTHVLAGSTDFVQGGLLAQHSAKAAPIASVLLGLFAFGIGKAALMPVHAWLPNAMVAPTPVSAFLHAVAVVKAGVFAILKIAVYIFGVDFLAETGAADLYLWIAAGSILLGSLIAMRKDNLKARLAYSTVAQLAYVTLGAMLATSMGIVGGGLQIAAHALGKMTLFMCAGAVYVAAHKTRVSEMRGLGRTMPVTFGAFFLGALSIVGVPPLAGSWPKFLLMLGSADAGQLAIVGVLILSSVLSAVYLISVPVEAFLMKPAAHGEKAQGAEGAPIDWRALEEAPLLCLAPPIATALGALALFFVADSLYNYLLPALEAAK